MPLEALCEMRRQTTLRLEPIASLSPLVGSSKIVTLDVGPDGMVYVVVPLTEGEYRQLKEATGVAPPEADRPRRYRVLGLLAGEAILDVLIEGEPFEIHSVQPLLDELLLVSGRSICRSRNDCDMNGRVYSWSGRFVREMFLGDAIESVQTTSSGAIWTSYFDEACLGTGVGASGLVAWSHGGTKQCEFAPAAGLGPILDCYALNVASKEDVWLYYYTEFPLVHLHRRKVASFWNVPVAGSDAFAIDENRHALFRGGYREHDRYQLLELKGDGAVQLLAKIDLEDRCGQPLSACLVAGRGDALYLLSDDNFLYRIDVAMALAM